MSVLLELIESICEFYSRRDCNLMIYGNYLKFVNGLPTDGIDGIIGLGFPFYYGIEGFDRGVEHFLEFLKGYKRKAQEKEFPCFDCYPTLGTTNVRLYCNPCESTEIKPRDIQKMAPDLDVLIIGNNKDSINLGSFWTSDANIYKAALGIIDACRGEGNFPIDLHFAYTEDFLKGLEFIQQNPTLGYRLPVTSYYGEWKENIKPIGMGTIGTCHYTRIADGLSPHIRSLIETLVKVFPTPESYLEEMRTVEAIRYRTEDPYFYNRMLGIIARNVYRTENFQ